MHCLLTANQLIFVGPSRHSYKFLRLFPLSQYDVPTTHPTLQFPQTTQQPDHNTLKIPSEKPNFPRSTMVKGSSITSKLTVEEVAKNNPTLDYTTPDLITLVISDSGILTPPGVADVLLSVFGGE